MFIEVTKINCPYKKNIVVQVSKRAMLDRNIQNMLFAYTGKFVNLSKISAWLSYAPVQLYHVHSELVILHQATYV